MALFGGTNLTMGPSGELVTMSAVSTMGKETWWQFQDVHEPFPGAFQRVVTERRESCLAFSAIYACVSLISGDIAKLPIRLVEQTKDGIWVDAQSSAFSPVLRKPNRYQTRIQFIAYWVISKLLYGNAYILKERDNRGVVTALYPLHPACVRPLVTDDGDVYYEIAADNLSGVTDAVKAPASEIIHDRMNTLFHPLVGVSPIYACAMSVTQGMRIQGNSSKFFENMSRPSGQLTAPGKISPETKKDLKEQFEREFGGGNLGRLLVSGDGLKYEAMSIPARDAQLIETLKWTVEDAARPFLMPLHKLGAGNPTVANAAQYNLEYYSNCVQKQIEDIELLLDEGLGLGEQFQNKYGVWIDEKNLLRMDAGAQIDALQKGVAAAIISPNEARKELNYAPVKGGEQPLAQQQNWPLSVLVEREPPDAGTAALPPPKPAVEDDDDEDIDAALRAHVLPPLIPQGWAHA